MVLCRFFEPVPRRRGLPDPAGPLSMTVPSPAIERTNEEVAREGSQVAELRIRSVPLTTSFRTACGLQYEKACDSGVAKTAWKLLRVLIMVYTHFV